ncbi:uncharacterized protein LOC112084413 [Eutrema salsugineum]|uniref:uncharacterized protein LOC112084413 n=1 Tax=Eutrema salsugineum TaxID=72664 RepID=UPI000CECE477|nr:uncharacterized protein LOC112084413 [Eutrema salsugineum]
MAICRQYGNPDLFITMTANPNWKEIKHHLAAYGGASPNDRPDIQCRVFKMKLDELLENLKKGTFFKPYTAVIHRIEFQKRGLPHAHILMWFGKSTKTPKPEDVDAIISAELPSKDKDPEGYDLVAKYMMHGLCGLDRPRSPCMEKQICTKKFPRPYTNHTTIDKSGYIIYRRRQFDEDYVMKEGTRLDNKYVIPHNMAILKKFKAHINVEWCNRTTAIKYLFKYITKGVDKATVVIEKGNDSGSSVEGKSTTMKPRNEIQEYLDCRYLSAHEAMWRTFGYHIHKRKPSVQKLIIHLPGQQNVTYKDTDNLDNVLQRPGIDQTMLTEYFELNKRSEKAQNRTYVQIPEHFVWDQALKIWTELKKGEAISRLVTIHPNSGDLYYLRIILNEVKGAQSFEELRIVNNCLHLDYKAACYAKGLLDNDKEWHAAMEETNTWATPFQLRQMFVTLLIYCEVGNPKELWKRCWKTLSEDITYRKQAVFTHNNLNLGDVELEQYTLIEVEKILHQH